jgi:NAD(P)-dependent dehydrogenase (short-subunit alcohol dehydrogenase family)
MTLATRRIVVTGGARGIGASAVAALAREGAAVASLDILDEPGEQLAAETTRTGPGTVHYLHCDVSRREEVRAAFATATETLGGLDGLLNVAAVELKAPAEEISDEDLALTLSVNVLGTMLTNQEAFPYLRDGGGGRILNFASCAALYPFLGGAHYSASKGAVISWTRTIAHEWGRYGIAANAINPVMWTPMYEASRARYTPEELTEHDAKMAQRIPLGGKSGDPDTEMAPVLVFLLGEGARFITGQIVSVDGGMVPLR